MAGAETSEISDLFSSGNKDLEPDVFTELQSIMRLHQLSAEDIFYKWESYCIKMDMDASSLNIETVRAFKQDIQDALEKTNRLQTHIKQEKKSGATPRNVARTGDVFGMCVSTRDKNF
jgi:DNA polymerase alpha subunit B